MVVGRSGIAAAIVSAQHFGAGHQSVDCTGGSAQDDTDMVALDFIAATAFASTGVIVVLDGQYNRAIVLIHGGTVLVVVAHKVGISRLLLKRFFCLQQVPTGHVTSSSPLSNLSLKMCHSRREWSNFVCLLMASGQHAL